MSLVGKWDIAAVTSSAGYAMVSDVRGCPSRCCVLQAGGNVITLRWLKNVITWMAPRNRCRGSLSIDAKSEKLVRKFVISRYTPSYGPVEFPTSIKNFSFQGRSLLPSRYVCRVGLPAALLRVCQVGDRRLFFLIKFEGSCACYLFLVYNSNNPLLLEKGDRGLFPPGWGALE